MRRRACWGVEVVVSIYLGLLFLLKRKTCFLSTILRDGTIYLYIYLSSPKGGQTLIHSCTSLKCRCLFSVYVYHYTYICLFHYLPMLCTLDLSVPCCIYADLCKAANLSVLDIPLQTPQTDVSYPQRASQRPMLSTIVHEQRD